jgi:hypothetical protein
MYFIEIWSFEGRGNGRIQEEDGVGDEWKRHTIVLVDSVLQ